LIEPRPPQEDESDAEDEFEDQDEPPSAKVVQLIELLRVQPWDSKSLVFSQFTSFLDKVCNNSGLSTPLIPSLDRRSVAQGEVGTSHLLCLKC